MKSVCFLVNYFQLRPATHPQGYYDEDWMDDQQAEDDFQNPEKFRKIASMVSLHGVSEDPPVQHQGGRCSQYNIYGMCGTTLMIRNRTCLRAR